MLAEPKLPSTEQAYANNVQATTTEVALALALPEMPVQQQH